MVLGIVTQSDIDTAIGNLVNTAPEHLDTLKELADAIEDTSNNKITALTTSISQKLSTTVAQSTYATISSVTTQLGNKQNTLTAGTNITIASDGTISAQAGTTINSLNDIANVDVSSKSNGQDFKAMGFNGTNWTAQDDIVGGGGGSGNGVTVIPSTAQSSLSQNIDYPTGFVYFISSKANTGEGKEGDIIYDASQNLFYEASNSKTDVIGNGEVQFRPLGYSFFAKNMEGQAPNVQSTSFFFLN